MTVVRVKMINRSGVVTVPARATSGAAAYDLQADIVEQVIIQPRERVLIPAGIAIALEEGFEAQVRPRSGLALKQGVTVLNAPGTIDADYRGEVGVILINHGDVPFTVRPGERIAQLVIAPVHFSVFATVDELDKTARGEGGYGHSGLEGLKP